ncbi:Cox19-like CHCH family protein [Trema orientale]|uniref:Cox19-like CHCH family protein n=1 Tax=Trema orientale TaxID=63057 RepID=A0A2P5FWZ5_TREOI|nr:Cox19-like CHCH family protein [Trema orientale]
MSYFLVVGSEQSQPPSTPTPTAAPTPLHQSDANDDDDNVKQLKECSSLYLALQDCLVNTNRNWKSCQIEVQALKSCNERKKNDKGE